MRKLYVRAGLIAMVVLGALVLSPAQSTLAVHEMLCAEAAESGSGFNLILAEPGQTTRGTNGDDVIIGTAGPDTIFAGDGQDLVCGRGGDDTIQGDRGGDDLIGDICDGCELIPGAGLNGLPGNDTIVGLHGDERMWGDAGNDVLRGGDGQDLFFGGAGDDRLSGGRGADSLDGDSPAGNSGQNDRCNGGAGSNDTAVRCEDVSMVP